MSVKTTSNSGGQFGHYLDTASPNFKNHLRSPRRRFKGFLLCTIPKLWTRQLKAVTRQIGGK